MLYDPELRANGGSVVAYEPCPTAAAEQALLSTVMALYKSGSLPGALQDIYAQQVRQQQRALFWLLCCQSSFRSVQRLHFNVCPQDC
jgi:hypothetical protein